MIPFDMLKDAMRVVEIREHDEDGNIDKTYYAVVHGHLENPKGRIINYLAENKDQFVYATTDETMGKKAETYYQEVGRSERCTALHVELVTGRKNQIRVHMADLGHPIVGDPKYGKKGDKFRRMALHAMDLSFDHPFSGRRMIFHAPVPPELLKLTEG